MARAAVGPDGGPSRRARTAPTALVGTTYLALNIVAHLRVWTSGAATHVQMGGGDLATYLWALRWPPYALAHGHHPFFTDWSNYPAGVNLLNNTSPFLLALLLSPVTLIWGSLATYNLLQTVAFAASAFAAYALLRRWTSWRAAAFVGGLLYGFSPFMVAAGWTHLFLVFAPIPPLIVICLDEIVVRQTGSPVRWGIKLALLVVAQFFISAEVLATTAELCVLGILAVALACRGEIRQRFRHATTGLVTGVAVAGAVLAYPIWFTLYGRQHVSVEFPAEVVSSDLLTPVISNSNLVLTTSALRDLGDSFAGPIVFMGREYVISGVGYLGIPLLLVLAVFTIRHRALPLVRLFAFLAAAAFIASLGPTLKVSNHVTGLPMPGRILTVLPVLDATVPYRYALFVPLAAAVVLAVGLDRLRDHLAARWSPGWTRLALASLIVVVLAPLVPRFPYSVMRVHTPEYFRSTAFKTTPAGSVLVLYPFPGAWSAETMVWQAHNDFHYRIVGGYQNLPDGRGGFSHEGNLSVTRDYLNDLFFGRTPPTMTPAIRRAILSDLHDWDAATIVVDTSAPGADSAVETFAEVLDRPPLHTKGVAVWYRLPSSPK